MAGAWTVWWSRGVPSRWRQMCNQVSGEPHIGFRCIRGDLPKTDMGWEGDPAGLGFFLRRIAYFEGHLEEISQLVTDGVPIHGYFAWSLLDNYEWAFGYSKRFGIVHVDYDSMIRTPKHSYHAWRDGLLAR